MTARWITADVFDGLATLETGSVDLIISSPPFLALRSYLPADHPDKHKEIGSEATPAQFIDVLLRVTGELRRVLAPHGSICIELGDTYAGSGGAGGDYQEEGLRDGQPVFDGSARRNAGGDRNNTGNTSRGTKAGGGWPLAKSRTLIPQLYEIALAYGINPLTGAPSPAGQWRIRNVVTWARPNPPVGALGDKWRPATSDLIVACVSAKRYWDDLATRKPHQTFQSPNKIQTDTGGSRQDDGQRFYTTEHPSGAPLLDYWEIPLLEGEEPKQYGPGEKPSRSHMGGKPKGRREDTGTDSIPTYRPNYEDRPLNEAGAPLLDYWEIPPGGYKGSHYAVFPEELVVPCVKAMCPEKVCRTCGEPSRRIVETQRTFDGEPNDDIGAIYTGPNGMSRAPQGVGHWRFATERQDLGWSDCGHDDYRPGLILDPFAGSGTTLSVATGHGHDAIGIDLDPRNADLARDRIGPFLFEETRML